LKLEHFAQLRDLLLVDLHVMLRVTSASVDLSAELFRALRILRRGAEAVRQADDLELERLERSLVLLRSSSRVVLRQQFVELRGRAGRARAASSS
jgi:hypothetical protein